MSEEEPSAEDPRHKGDIPRRRRITQRTVIVLSVAFLTSLYHLSVPVRTSWRHDIPGASLALLVWILGSFLLRWALQGVIGGPSIYGPLAAPIAVLLWLYLTAVAILVGVIPWG